MKTAQGVQGKPSLLVKIPRQPATMLGGGFDAGVASAPSPRRSSDAAGALSGLPPGLGAAAVTPSPAGAPAARRNAIPPPAPRQPSPASEGYGRLRSLEDR
jgi:hypothetical protein